jgi:hypothetical protein
MPISTYDGTNYQPISLTKLLMTNTSLFPWLWVSLFPYARPANTNVFRFVRSYVPIGNSSNGKAQDAYDELFRVDG